MKALSLKQPWLWAVMNDKDIENRTWKPPQHIIGKFIALHASLKDDLDGPAAIKRISGVNVNDIPDELPRGKIVAVAKMVGWISETDHDIPSPCLGHMRDDKWFFGPIGWILSDKTPLVTPVQCRGSLGLWDIPVDTLNDMWVKVPCKATGCRGRKRLGDGFSTSIRANKLDDYHSGQYRPECNECFSK